MRALAAVAVLVLPSACGKGGAAIDAARPQLDDAAAPVVDGGSDLAAEVFASYGVLETVAGLGQIGDKGVNGWSSDYEGGSAVDAELSRPHIALADEAGTIYIADKDAHAIRAVSPAGVITTVAGTGVAGDDGDGPAPAASSALSSPNGLWVTPQGAFYVLDMGSDKVRKVTTDGTMTTLFQVGGVSTGRGLWVADDESRVLVAAGSALKQWTPEGGVTVVASGFVSLGNIAVSGDGQILVTDRMAHRVYSIGGDGSKTAIAGNGTTSGGGDGQSALETGFDEVRGIWPNPGGGYFLATHKGGQVWFVDDVGIAHLFVDGDGGGDTHAGDGQLFSTPGKKISEPRAVTMDSQGNLLITENDVGYIRRVVRAD